MIEACEHEVLISPLGNEAEKSPKCIATSKSRNNQGELTKVLQHAVNKHNLMSPPEDRGSAESALPLRGPAKNTEPTTPPESPNSAWTRRLILFAFWAVVVVFGLPHWIWTTSIHRSNLPLESMNSWANGRVSC